MAKELVATVTSKGQLTLPKPVRELLRIELGDYVRFEPTDRGILLTKISLEKPFTESEWKALGRAANQKGKRFKNAKEFLKDLDKL